MNLHEEQIGAWMLRFTYDHVQTLPHWALAQCLSWINAWEAHFPRETTWVSQHCKRHSLLVKLDIANLSEDDKEIAIYGVDETPDGLGAACIVNPAVYVNLRAVMETWPNVRLLKLQNIGDDEIWLGPSLKTTEAVSHQGPLLIRGGTPEQRFAWLKSSITPARLCHLRDWGETLGLWHTVHSPEELNFNQSFALKPPRGASANNVLLWRVSNGKSKPGEPSNKFDGLATAKGIGRALLNGPMYCQPFIAPMICQPLSNGKCWQMIYRVFFAFNIATGQYEYLGGFWLARERQWKLHGAPDAVCGPVC